MIDKATTSVKMVEESNNTIMTATVNIQNEAHYKLTLEQIEKKLEEAQNIVDFWTDLLQKAKDAGMVYSSTITKPPIVKQP